MSDARTASSESLVTELSAQAPIPPHGLLLSLDPAKGITLGGSTIPLPGEAGSLLLVAIDSATGAVTRTSRIPGSGVGSDSTRSIKTLMEGAERIPGPQLDPGDPRRPRVQRHPWCVDDTYLESLSAALDDLGIEDTFPAAEGLGCGQPFAYVGTPGAIDGSATFNPVTGTLPGRSASPGCPVR